MSKYGVISGPNAGKYGTETTPYLDTFHAVIGSLSLTYLTTTGSYMLKFNKSNTRTRSEICSKLTIKTPKRRHGVVLVSLLLALNIFHTLS